MKPLFLYTQRHQYTSFNAPSVRVDSSQRDANSVVKQTVKQSKPNRRNSSRYEASGMLAGMVREQENKPDH